MTKRKSLSKKTRFEVFKRDSFTCQYCGAKAPDVILEVDHITPVAEGGDNDLTNLVTSCFDCNRGKGKRVLSDDAVVAKRRSQLEHQQERLEQLEMMNEWRKSVSEIEAKQVDSIEDVFIECYGIQFCSQDRARVRRMIRQFGFQMVLMCADIACVQYDDPGDALSKLGGICYNKSFRDC